MAVITWVVKDHRGKRIGVVKAHNSDVALTLARNTIGKKHYIGWVETYEENAVYDNKKPDILPEVIEGVIIYNSISGSVAA